MDNHVIDNEEPQFRTIKYHKHGILKKFMDYKSDKVNWVFEGPDITDTFHEFDLVDVLDELSINGYELVTSINDGEYILRTKDEVEEDQEYYEDDKGSIAARV
jgi:hypothetical protein